MNEQTATFPYPLKFLLLKEKGRDEVKEEPMEAGTDKL
jgi:hypothetical protein